MALLEALELYSLTICGNCGHFKCKDTGKHLNDYLITRNCDKENK